MLTRHGRQPRLRSIVILTLLSMSSCTSSTVTECAGWRPIRLLAAEETELSRETKAEILAHDLHGVDMGCWTR